MAYKNLFFIFLFFKVSTIFAQPTYSNDIANIVYAKCTYCHFDGGLAPFPLTSYNEVLSHINSIKTDVENKIMPPWPVDNNYKSFADDRSLTDAQIATLLAWINNGAPEGDPLTTPNPPTYSNVPKITNPDLIVQIPDYTIKEYIINGEPNDLYHAFVIPTGISTTKYITDLEVIPGNSSVVHHVLVYTDSSTVPLDLDAASPDEIGYDSFSNTGSDASRLVGVWAPGSDKEHYPSGMGFELPANSNIVLQIHYPEGTQGQIDHTSVRFKLVDFVPRVLNLSEFGKWGFGIPANTITTLTEQFPPINEVSMLGIFPHMHLLGKKMKIWGVTTENTILPFINVDNWDFHWQLFYKFKHIEKIPSNMRFNFEATFDNTTANPDNPNSPPIYVSDGESSTEEMMLFFVLWTNYQAGDENISLEKKESVSANQNICDGSPLTDITVTDSVGFIQWQSSTDGVNFTDLAVASATTATLLASEIAPFLIGKYYFRAALTSFSNTIYSNTVMVEAPSAILTSAPETANQTICLGMPITTVAYRTTTDVTGITLELWPDGIQPVYDAVAHTFTITGTPTVPGVYHLQFIGGCPNPFTYLTLTVVDNSASGTVSPNQNICNGVPLSNITITCSVGAIQWQSSTDGVNFTDLAVASATTSTLLASEIAPFLIGKYYFRAALTSFSNTIYSNTVMVEAPSAILTSAPETANQTICLGMPITTVAYRTTTDVTGITLEPWPDGIQPLYDAVANTFTIIGTPTTPGVYHLQFIGGCPNPYTYLTLTVTNVVPAAPTGVSSQSLALGATISDIVVNEPNVIWYASNADALANINPIAPDTAVVSGNTYYGIQVVGCRSASSLAVTMATLVIDDLDLNLLKVYPSPVKDILNISYSQEISNVEVFNLTGQKVFAKKENSSSIQINLSKLEMGLYILKIYSGKNIKYLKIIKT